jgi:hypothetical protein
MTAIVPSSDSKGNRGSPQRPVSVQNCGASPRKKNATEATPMGRKAGIAGDGVRQLTIF